MKNKYILIWENENNEIKTKTADNIDELYIFKLEKGIRADFYKWIRVGIVEKS